MKKIQETIDYWKNKFQILKDWKIAYNETVGTSECLINSTNKTAIIGKYQMFVKGELCSLDQYLCHELLHCAMSAMKQDIDNNLNYEELLVQDLTRLITKNI